MTTLSYRQEQFQAMKQMTKQDYEIDLIDDNRLNLIEQEKVQIKFVKMKYFLFFIN